MIALALALLSYVRVSGDGLTYRSPEVWSNEATLELSDPSYPELRSKLPPTADPNRFTGLVEQYVALATSDDVLNSLKRQRLISRLPEESGLGAISATSVASPINGAITPLLKITGMASTPAQATRLTMGATDTLIKVATARQVKAKIPESQRVKLRISTRASVPKLVGPRSKTTFILILLAGFTVTVAAAFMRENLRRKAEAETAPVFEGLVLEAQPPASTGPESVRAAQDDGCALRSARGWGQRARSSIRRPSPPAAFTGITRAETARAAPRHPPPMTHVRTATLRAEFDWATLFLAGGFALLGASVLLGRETTTIAAVVSLGAVLAAWHQTILRWPAVISLLVSIMLFVPIGRYSIPVELPFGIELYRVAVALVLAGWAAALLVDPSVRLRRSPFQTPLLIIMCATLGSLAVNVGRVAPLGSAVLKSVTFLLSFVLVHYFLISVVRSRRTVETLTKFLVVGTAVVAAFSILEQRVQFQRFRPCRDGLAIPRVQRPRRG